MMRPCCWPLVALVALLVPPSSFGQAEDDPFRVGTHVFRLFMHHNQITPLANWNDVTDNPEETILVLLGEVNRIPINLDWFVRNGGAVLLASDHEILNNDIANLTGHYLMGHRVYTAPPRAPKETRVPKDFLYLRGGEIVPQCVIVDPTLEGGPDLFWNAPLGKRKAKLRVVTNRAGFVGRLDFNNRPGVHVLAEFPIGCWNSLSQGFLQRWDNKRFAVSAEAGKGRLLLLSDHSVFINEMVLQEDNNNLDFTYQVITWLKDGKRKKVLFVEDGTIQTQLKVPLRGREVTIQDLEADLVNIGNGQAREIQKNNARSNGLNREVLGFLNEGPGRAIFGRESGDNFYLLLILIAGVGAAAFGLFSLMRASHRNDTTVPLFETISGRQRAAVSPLILRQRAALHADDLREFGREAAREWFAALPGCPEDETSPHPPRIEARGGWWKQRQVRQEVLGLWHLARESEMSPLSQQEYRQLLARIDRLQLAIDAGELRISW